MRITRFRPKLWWLMAAVAVVALGLRGEQYRRHYRRCKQAAAYHAKESRLHARRAAAFQKGIADMDKAFLDYASLPTRATPGPIPPLGKPSLDREIEALNKGLDEMVKSR